MKKFLTFLLVFAMLLSLPAVSVAAEDTGASDTGSVGETEDTVTGQGDGLKLYGYQNAIVEAGAAKVSVRVIAEVADVDTYKSLCFHVKTAKAEKDYPVTFVYGKLTASLTDGEGATFREELLPRTEGNYLAAVILTDIPVSADAEMTITPCGTRKDGTAVTGDASTLRKPAGSTEFTTTYQVRFETAEGTEISTVSVMRGENATFPTPSGSTYYTADKAEYAKAFNVTANQTITLGQVATSEYNTTVTKISCNTNSQDTNKSLYSFELKNIGGSGESPNQNSSRTFLYKVGHALEFTTDFADTLVLRMNCQEAASMTVAVYVDGYLSNSVTVNDTDYKSMTNLTIGTGIPAGKHTVRLVVTDLVGTPSKLRGLAITEIHFKGKKV